MTMNIKPGDRFIYMGRLMLCTLVMGRGSVVSGLYADYVDDTGQVRSKHWTIHQYPALEREARNLGPR